MTNLLGWHNRFNRRVNRFHPNIWHLIHVLKKEEIMFRQQLLKVKAGGQKLKAKKVTAMQQRLDTLAKRFQSKGIDLEEYLEGLSLLVAKKSTGH